MTPLTIQQTFDLALQHHQAGRLHFADQLYREILARDPDHPGAIHYLGVSAHQVGNIDIALELIRRAITLDPQHASAYANLGNALRDAGAARQTANTPPGMSIIDYTDELRDFSDTAALVAHMDLVISVDTAVAHLAGAMAKPIWLLLPFVPDWRWLLKRDDCPWYPTMRLFRQTTLGDWPGVILRVVEALHAIRPE